MKRVLFYVLLFILGIGFLGNSLENKNNTEAVIAIFITLMVLLLFYKSYKSKKLDTPVNNKKQPSNRIQNQDSDEISVDTKFVLTDIELEVLSRIPRYKKGERLYNIYNVSRKDVAKLVRKFIRLGLLKPQTKEEYLNSLKVEDLKNLLRNRNLKVNGRKAELIERIIQEVPEQDYIGLMDLDVYNHSDEAKAILRQYKIRKNQERIEIEDKCYSLILSGKINQAYKEIAKYESQKPIPRGLGVDWEKALINGLSKLDLINYTDHLKLEQDLPPLLEKYQKQLNACVILGQMLGVSYNKILKLFQRICNVECDKQLIYEAIVMNCNYFFGKRDILSYLEDGVETYKYVATLDIETCERCAELDGKIFKVRDAEFGVNYPPMCKTCRCTTVPYYYEDSDYSDDTRMARDPVTGKPYEVPANMTYKEWYKKYVEK